MPLDPLLGGWLTVCCLFRDHLPVLFHVFKEAHETINTSAWVWDDCQACKVPDMCYTLWGSVRSRLAIMITHICILMSLAFTFELAQRKALFELFEERLYSLALLVYGLDVLKQHLQAFGKQAHELVMLHIHVGSDAYLVHFGPPFLLFITDLPVSFVIIAIRKNHEAFQKQHFPIQQICLVYIWAILGGKVQVKA